MKIQTVFTPALYSFAKHSDEFICVVVDVLRATTTMATIIDFGGQIIPVASLDKAREYKANGYLVAGERIEQTLDFADFGNSALNFRSDVIRNKTIVHTTTNGTQAIELAKQSNASQVVIGAFSNISALTDYLIAQKKDVEIICSGWKNTFCLEDTLFAGALAARLFSNQNNYTNKENNNDSIFYTHDDSTFAAMDLWQKAKDNPLKYLEKASHIHRLRKAHFDDVFEYTFTLDTCHSVPILCGDKLIKAE